MEKEQEIIRTSLRLPKGLYDKISEIAERHGLTMHAEILRMLNVSIALENDTPSQRLPEDSVSKDMREALVILEEFAAKTGSTITITTRAHDK